MSHVRFDPYRGQEITVPHPTFYEIEKNIAFVVNKLNNLSVKFLITMYRMRFSIMLEAARLELEFTKYKNSR